jgi:hypothetical protein
MSYFAFLLLFLVLLPLQQYSGHPNNHFLSTSPFGYSGPNSPHQSSVRLHATIS